MVGARLPHIFPTHCLQVDYGWGDFTSPHLQSYTERIQINDGNITEEAFGNLISRVKWQLILSLLTE